ncbi:MAG TPA: DNA double-strand break repair nuclease NurA [Micromonosporaceae bacterium]
MKLHVDTWDPGYGTGFEPGEASGPGGQSSAELRCDVELREAAWRPVHPPVEVRPPDVVLLVDGVRRIDARVWVLDDFGSHPGLAASYAAGVVRCDLGRGSAELAAATIERGLFTAAPAASAVQAGTVRYVAHKVNRGEPNDLVLGVQRQLRALEVKVSTEARDDSGEDLLVVDGPLQGRTHLPRVLGYVKTHRVEYLPASLAGVVTSLEPGERCPVFKLGTSWHRYTWYLRLPGAPGAPWAGIVRIECSAELSEAAAIALADLSAVTLPLFASTPYKDPRAPQNLVPIAGLERRLRALLGDARLLHRTLLRAAALS